MRKGILVVSASALLATSLPLSAQTTSGTLLGSVHDKSGAGVPDAKITVENNENGNRRATRTDDSGNYQLPNLPPGDYKVTASKAGFLEQTIKDFPLQFNQKNLIKLPRFTLETAALKGKTVDTAGNILPNARVVVSNESGEVKREAITNQDGDFSVSNLPPDKYIINASWSGSSGEISASASISLDQIEVHAPILTLTRKEGEKPTPVPPAKHVVHYPDALVHTVDLTRASNFTS